MKKLFLFCVSSLCLMTVLTSNVLAEKTFKNTNGNFLRADDYDYGKSDDGECVRYVRYEIGGGDIKKHYNVCNGYAHTCYNKAESAGYAVGQVARVGAIVVFKRNMGGYKDAGHVGIVKTTSTNSFVIRESNVEKVHVVGERVIQKDDPAIRGYIYPNNSGYFYVSEKNIHIAWSPRDVPCDKASVWSYNQTCSAENNHADICQTAHYQLLQENYGEYSKGKYETMFFGDIQNFQQFVK